MPMVKKSATAEAVASAPKVEAPKADSGTAAAVERLQKSSEKKTAIHSYAGRDYNDVNDAKSIRILRQGVYQHALVSPALAGLKFKNLTEYLALVKEAADKTIEMILADK